VGRRTTKAMRTYWDEAAERNPMFYVDTSLDFDHPDEARFLEGGRRVASIAVDECPVSLSGYRLAVEIGSGLGRVCAALATRFDRVVGIDISESMVRQARELVTNPSVEFRHGDGLSLPGIADDSVDLVVTFTVFQHALNRAVIRANLREAARVLRPGGVLAMQWNATPGVLRWRAHRLRMRALAAVGRADAYGRDAAAFLGTRVPLTAMDRMLADVGLTRVGLLEPDTLFSWAWAQKDATA
jgi:SAM-dependent methyltransferase